jgi:methylmalonyl-CoA mutase cobalamin-binding subunit
VAAAWRDLLCPVLISVGQRQAETGRMIEVEHLLSRSIQQALLSVARPAAAQTPQVLLACADEEQHTLAIEALAAALAEHGCPSRMLGARVPGQALADAVHRTGPAAVLVWSQTPHTGTTDQAHQLLDLHPRPIVIAAAGPGWPDDLPDGLDHPANLDDAIDLILHALT